MQKHRSNAPDKKTLGHTEEYHPTAAENDVPHMTPHDDNGDSKTSVEERMTLFSFVCTSLLPPRKINSISPSITVHLQSSQENNKDTKTVNSILLEQLAPPTHVNFDRKFLLKLDRKVVRKICCPNYFKNTGKVNYEQAVKPKACLKEVIRMVPEDFMQGHPWFRKIFIKRRQRNHCPNVGEKVQSSINNCETYTKAKPKANQHIRVPL